MRIALVGAELEENLAIRYLRAALANAGHQVVQVDFNCAQDTESVARLLVEGAPALIGLSMVFTARAREFCKLAGRTRALGYRGHVVAGGHFAAFNAEALLQDHPAIDSVGAGEGEGILCDLADSLADLSQVSGLVWRNSEGGIVRNEARAPSDDLDQLPWPVRRCPPDSYLGLPIVNMLQSRGCSHACAFCSIAAWHSFRGGPRHRVRNIDDVADEMASLYADGVRIFNFHDDNFLLRDPIAARARVLALQKALRGRGVGRIAFAIKARPDEVNHTLFALLKEMGLFRVFLGIEAGTAESLRALGRGQSISENERALDVVNQLGLHTCFNLLLLNPDSTLEDLMANEEYLRRRPDNPMNFCRTEIYAGTPLERKLRREGRLLGDYFGYDYRIADARAERACELAYQVFAPRNYGAACLHHLVMNVDYENTLLAHFHLRGSKGNPGLAADVKAFIRRANLNTCDYLDEVITKAGSTLGGSEPSEINNLGGRMRTDESRLSDQANRLLDRIRQEASGLAALVLRPRRPRPPLRSRTAAAGFAASLAVAGGYRTALAGDNPASSAPQSNPRPKVIAPSHFNEMAPRRPVPRGTEDQPKPEPVPPPKSDRAQDAELRNEIAKKVLQAAVAHLGETESLEIQVILDEKGKVAKATVRRPEDRAKEIEKAVRALRFKPPGKLASQTIDLSFTADEVQSELAMQQQKKKQPPRTHPEERVPFRPRPHYAEEIP